VTQRNNMTHDQLRAELAKEGTTWEAYRKEVEEQLKRNKYIGREVTAKVNITNSDMQQYYKDHMNEFAGGSTAHIAQITLPFNDQMTKQDFETWWLRRARLRHRPTRQILHR
jgi:peptidyl-prolyl cis-trans isomerase SurA